MTTTNKALDLASIDGNELLEDYADYVKTTAMEARAIVSVKTGSLQHSTVVVEERDGFTIYSSPSLLRHYSRFGEYYAFRYSKLGYKRWGPFPYIETAAEQIAKSPEYSIGKSHKWEARFKGVKRMGAGYADDRDLDNGVLEVFTKKNVMKVKIPERLRK